uniref:Uncharacterized protein n=1 Tax=Entomoneis paludosa TaxID=265537 RepID=A0A7S2YG46_9STRA
MSAPKRDKFAALAASQCSRSEATPDSAATSAPGPAATEETTHVSKKAKISKDEDGVGNPSSGESRAGGKFAALQKASTAPKRDKFSAMASRGSTASTTPETTALEKPNAASEEQIQKWKKRCLQREELWRNMEEAEVQVLELLEHAQKTVESLAQQTTTDDLNPTEVQQLASRVPQCIQKIHDNLAPAAQFIQAYEAPQRINRLYQARVEEGLAVQKQQVLRELVDLEKDENNTVGEDE